MSEKKWFDGEFREIKIKIPLKDLLEFKKICFLKNTTMQYEIEKFIRKTIDKNKK